MLEGGGGGEGGGRGNPGVSLPLHNVWERMCAEGGNPGVSPLPLHNVLGDTTACIMGLFFFVC